jgi:hypothetical protein
MQTGLLRPLDSASAAALEPFVQFLERAVASAGPLKEGTYMPASWDLTLLGLFEYTPRLWMTASAAWLPAYICQCLLPRTGSSEPCASPSLETMRVRARSWMGRKALSRAVSILDTTGGIGQRGSLFASYSRRLIA